MRTNFFTTIFPVNHWFWVAAVEPGCEFFIIYILITIFVNNEYSKLNNVSNFVFHCTK